METQILKTEEVFSVELLGGTKEKLFKQTYSNKPPHYHIETSFRTPVEASSSNILEILKYRERHYKISKDALNNSTVNNNPKAKEVHSKCLEIEKTFLDKLREYAKQELINA